MTFLRLFTTDDINECLVNSNMCKMQILFIDLLNFCGFLQIVPHYKQGGPQLEILVLVLNIMQHTTAEEEIGHKRRLDVYFQCYPIILPQFSNTCECHTMWKCWDLIAAEILREIKIVKSVILILVKLCNFDKSIACSLIVVETDYFCGFKFAKLDFM